MPDSFKGTMNSIEICDIMRQALAAHYPVCEVISISVVDGEEGIYEFW